MSPSEEEVKMRKENAGDRNLQGSGTRAQNQVDLSSLIDLPERGRVEGVRREAKKKKDWGSPA